MAKKDCTIYLVRHGETDNNKNKIIQGSAVDSPLNSVGEEQARVTALRLKKIPFAAAFSSDLVRAQKTAQIIALEHQLAVTTKSILRERNFGRFEGRPEAELRVKLKTLLDKFEALSDEEKFKFNFPYGIENLDVAISRLITFLREVSLAYLNKTVLVVCHGALIRHFLIHIGFATFDELRWAPGMVPPIENLGCAVLSCDGVDFFVKDTFGINKRV